MRKVLSVLVLLVVGFASFADVHFKLVRGNQVDIESEVEKTVNWRTATLEDSMMLLQNPLYKEIKELQVHPRPEGETAVELAYRDDMREAFSNLREFFDNLAKELEDTVDKVQKRNYVQDTKKRGV